MAAKKDTKKLIKDLAEIINKTDLTEIELEEDGLRIRVASGSTITQVSAPITTAAPAPQQAENISTATSPAQPTPQDDTNNPGTVKSPMVGTVYVAPDPDSPAFISEGDTVKVGQPLFIVEAMKVMNPINAPKAGTVKKILVSDAEPIEFEQPLVIIE